jgi:hypothetical protein
MSREEAITLALKALDLARRRANRLDDDNSNSSRPPSSDSPSEGDTTGLSVETTAPTDAAAAAPAPTPSAFTPSGRKPAGGNLTVLAMVLAEAY